MSNYSQRLKNKIEALESQSPVINKSANLAKSHQHASGDH